MQYNAGFENQASFKKESGFDYMIFIYICGLAIKCFTLFF